MKNSTTKYTWLSGSPTYGTTFCRTAFCNVKFHNTNEYFSQCSFDHQSTILIMRLHESLNDKLSLHLVSKMKAVILLLGLLLPNMPVPCVSTCREWRRLLNCLRIQYTTITSITTAAATPTAIPTIAPVEMFSLRLSLSKRNKKYQFVMNMYLKI